MKGIFCQLWYWMITFTQYHDAARKETAPIPELEPRLSFRWLLAVSKEIDEPYYIGNTDKINKDRAAERHYQKSLI